MLFRQSFLDGIRRGTVTLAFRRWRRPTVRAGGTLLTAAGQLEITAVRPVRIRAISDADARCAGYRSRAALLEELSHRDAGRVYRIELGALRPDPRIALRRSLASGRDVDRVFDRLRGLDTRSAHGPWTEATLAIIRDHPARRAGDLAAMLKQEREPFKVNVRKLKTLGLTESLEIRYQLSPRGEHLLRKLGSKDGLN